MQKDVLEFNYIVAEIEDTRSVKDRRFKVCRVVVSYSDEAGNEYRKSFEAKGKPEIPQRGTHEELNRLKIQY